jgi:hypothetical protein
MQFQLSGESNSIKYDFSPQFFDCGMQPYDRVTDKEFFVVNSGKVSPPPHNAWRTCWYCAPNHNQCADEHTWY